MSFVCLDSSNLVVQSVQAAASSCPSGTLVLSEYQPFSLINELALIGIDPTTFAIAYFWGAGSIIAWWGAPYVVSALQAVIRKI